MDIQTKMARLNVIIGLMHVATATSNDAEEAREIVEYFIDLLRARQQMIYTRTATSLFRAWNRFRRHTGY